MGGREGRGAGRGRPPPLSTPRSTALHAALGALATDHAAATAVDVPVELLAALDDGGSPDEFTAAAFRRGARANQLCKGKAVALGALRDATLKGAEAAFPVASAQYRAATEQK